MSSEGGYGIIESLIVIIALSVLIVVVIDRYERITLVARETALKAELLNIRQAITLFQILNGRYPKDLQELLAKEYILPYKEDPISRKYLEPYSVDERMNILDPFGLPYIYFPTNGSVRSQTEGKEHY